MSTHIKDWRQLVVLFSLLLIPVVWAVTSGYAAIITSLHGEVRIRSVGKWAPAEPFLPLPSGTDLQLGSGAEVSLSFVSGKRAQLNGPCMVQLLLDGVRVVKGGPERLRYDNSKSRPNVPLPKDLNLERMGGLARGDLLLHADPVQLGDKVRVRWKSEPADGFELQLLDVETLKSIASVELGPDSREYVFQEGLLPGRSYRLRLLGRYKDREDSQASRFRIISEQERLELTQLQADEGELLLAYLSKDLFEPALEVALRRREQYPQAEFLRDLIRALVLRTGR